MANHLSFVVGGAVLTGDLVMGWASTMVSPPDGDLTAFLASAARLAAREDRVFYPGHGAPIAQPQERARWLIAHRQGREQQILAALNAEPQSIPALTAQIYTDVPPALFPAAERNVFAHLIDLHGRGMARATPQLGAAARFFV
jgi:glyoxylase-like metal-dependent hydrolase (beta-lactamase superfamily II)